MTKKLTKREFVAGATAAGAALVVSGVPAIVAAVPNLPKASVVAEPVMELETFYPNWGMFLLQQKYGPDFWDNDELWDKIIRDGE